MALCLFFCGPGITVGAQDLSGVETETLLNRYFAGDREVLMELGRGIRCEAVNQYLRKRSVTESVEALLNDLGNGDFKERESATAALMARGPDVLPAVQDYARAHAKDPEIAMRCKTILNGVTGKTEGGYQAFEKRFLLLEQIQQVDPVLLRVAQLDFIRFLEEKPDFIFTESGDKQRLRDFCRVYVKMGGEPRPLMTWMLEVKAPLFKAAGEGVLQADFNRYLPRLLSKKGYRVIPVMYLLVGPFQDQPTAEQWAFLMQHITDTRYHHEPFIEELAPFQTLPAGFLAQLDVLFASEKGEMQEFALYFVTGKGERDKERVTDLFARLQKENRYQGIAGKINDMKPSPEQAQLFIEVLEALKWEAVLAECEAVLTKALQSGL
ncbi:hypothetical protein P0Y35_14985 [Kiritimatiellaeota bacterium B1221]|nr:hypothetical protein [Kiritimatiellaeota bacterium B1221]